MANELKPIQSSQNLPAVTEAPVAINFLELPQDVLFQILQRIWAPKHVANLNLVSKSIKSLNQESIVAAPRLETFFFNTYGTHDPSVNHSYRDYIQGYSFPGDFTSVLGIIESQFPKSLDTVGRWQLAPLTSEMHSYLLSQFNLLRTGSQLKALLAISSSFNASQEITKLFYDALPPAVQKELRWQIWNANGPEGKSSVTSDGIDRGLYFGEHIIANEINSPLAHFAIINYLSKFGVDVPVPLLGKGGLPDEVQLQILQQLFEAQDVANLNLVSKHVYTLNHQPGAIVDARIQALFTEGMYGFLVLNVGANPAGDSYQDYVRAYTDSRGPVVRQFYDALPPDMQNELGRTIWETNGRMDNGMGPWFGQNVIYNMTSSPLMQAALRQYLSNFGVDTSINS